MVRCFLSLYPARTGKRTAPGCFSAPQEPVMTQFSRIGLGALLAAVSISTVYAQAVMQPTDPSAPKTRAQVRADLAEWRAAGFDPFDWLNYPENAQRAGRIVAQQREQQGNAPTTVQ
jgi:hypothetical protein